MQINLDKVTAEMLKELMRKSVPQQTNPHKFLAELLSKYYLSS